jgi:hypothetical protein
VIPARMMIVDSVSARDRKVKKDISIRIDMTIARESAELGQSSKVPQQLTRWFFVRQEVFGHGEGQERIQTMRCEMVDVV